MRWPDLGSVVVRFGMKDTPSPVKFGSTSGGRTHWYAMEELLRRFVLSLRWLGEWSTLGL